MDTALSQENDETGPALADQSPPALVVRCKAGDEASWRALFDENVDFVSGVARSLGIPAAEVDDVCQEVFVVVWRRLDQFQGGKLTTWLYRITANVVSGRHRKRRTRQRLGDVLVRLGIRPASVATPDVEYERTDARRQVDEVIALMSDKKRQVFSMFELEGLSSPEIAERLGCPQETVRTRLFHARREFTRLASNRGYLE